MIQFPSLWHTILLSYNVDDLHLTLIFDVLTPKDYDLTMKTMNRLFSSLPREIEVEFNGKTFKSPYNDKRGKIAQEVNIITDISQFIPVIERYNRAVFRPHISVPVDSLRIGFTKLHIQLTPGAMHKSKFSGFPYYTYNYIFNGGKE